MHLQARQPERKKERKGGRERESERARERLLLKIELYSFFFLTLLILSTPHSIPFQIGRKAFQSACLLLYGWGEDATARRLGFNGNDKWRKTTTKNKRKSIPEISMMIQYCSSYCSYLCSLISLKPEDLLRFLFSEGVKETEHPLCR